jgi:peptidoglycan/xylan/chitin deacetylase (PgdA/CDA1 family)
MIYAKHGNIVRLIYLVLAVCYYMLTFRKRWFSNESVILCYHGITSEQNSKFRRQMVDLSSKQTFSEQKKMFPRVIITFDDAFENLLDNAIPVLEEFKIQALIFVVANNMGKTPQWKIDKDHPDFNEKTMDTEQLKSIGQHPLIRIGSHTLTHPCLSDLSSDVAMAELLESKIKIENLIGYTIEDIALPHGSYNQKVLAVAQDTGYKRIYTLDPKTHDFSSDNKIIGRFLMSPDVWRIEFFFDLLRFVCMAFNMAMFFRES